MSSIAYADDIALLDGSSEAVPEALDRVVAAVSLRINATKTKFLSTQVAVTQQRQFFLDEVPLEECI